MAVVDSHPAILRSIAATKGAFRLMPPSLAAALHYQFAEKDETMADLFFLSLVSGANLNETDPIHVLRERLLESRLDPLHRLRQSIIAALSIKAWNLLRDNKTCRYLRIQSGGKVPETFPKVR